MPIEYADEEDLTLTVNQNEAERIGLEIPKEFYQNRQR